MKWTAIGRAVGICAVSAASVATAVVTWPARAEKRGDQPATSGAKDLRLASIAYRIATANADHCRTPDPLTGMLIHDQSSYDESVRPAIFRRYGLAAGFGVRALVAGSAADRAGIRPGDEIVRVDRVEMNLFRPDMVGRKASSHRTEAFEDFLAGKLRAGSATMTIQRHGAPISFQLMADPGCGGRTVVVPANDFNAWSDGRYVAVTSRLMNDVADDSELAFVVAHEMSHNILQHSLQLRGRSHLLAEFGIGSGRVKMTEVEADTLAVGLLMKAGYNLEAPARFLVRSEQKRPYDFAITHPGLKRRLEIVNVEIAKLQSAPAPAAKAALAATVADAAAVEEPRSFQSSLAPETPRGVRPPPRRGETHPTRGAGPLAATTVPGFQPATPSLPSRPAGTPSAPNVQSFSTP
jgi:Peptidase family M48/PDZ domain